MFALFPCWFGLVSLLVWFHFLAGLVWFPCWFGFVSFVVSFILVWLKDLQGLQ
jgi:hypothetical protein